MVLNSILSEVFCYLIVVVLVKKVIIFGADMISSVHIDKKKKVVLIPGKRPGKNIL